MGRRYKSYERKTIQTRKQAGNKINAAVYKVKQNSERAKVNFKFQQNTQPSAKNSFIMKNRLVIELNDYMTLSDKHKCFMNIEPSENCSEYTKSTDEPYSVIKNVTLVTVESDSSNGEPEKCTSNQNTKILNEVRCSFLPENSTTTKFSSSPILPKCSVLSTRTPKVSQKSNTATTKKQILLFKKPFMIELKPQEKELIDDEFDLNVAKNTFFMTPSSLEKDISNCSYGQEKKNPLLSKAKHENSKNDFTNFIKQEDLEDSFFNIKEENEEDIINAIKQENSDEMYPMELKTIGSSDFEYFDVMDAQQFFDSEILGI